jgi:hypothetical protein
MFVVFVSVVVCWMMPCWIALAAAGMHLCLLPWLARKVLKVLRQLRVEMKGMVLMVS